MLLGGPGDNARSQSECIASHTPPGVEAVGPIRIGKSDKADGIGTTEDKFEVLGAFEVANNSNRCVPMRVGVGVEELGQLLYGICDIWA